MNKIRENIYLGNEDVVQDIKMLKSAGINAVFNVGDNSLDPYYPSREMLMVKVGLEDNQFNEPRAKDLAVGVLGSLLDRGYVVYVHCVAGASRSPFIVARYLAERENRDIREVLTELKQLRQEVFLEPPLLQEG